MTKKTSSNFRKPPISEVVCGVQFGGAEGLITPHFGLLAQRLKSEYQQFEDHPPLPTLQLEQQNVVPSAEFRSIPPIRRVFFVQPPGNFLIQLQQNRFLHNWRKLNETDEYPRFEKAFRRFESAWQMFQGFLASESLSSAIPEILELTYINHIVAEGESQFPRDVQDFLAFYQYSPEAVGESGTVNPAAAAMQFAWSLPNSLGTLTLDLKHGVRPSDDRQVLLLDLSVRGKYQNDADSMSTWFNLAHGAIVNTFDRFTTDKAHALWGKY